MPDNPYVLAQKFRGALVARDAKASLRIARAYKQVLDALMQDVIVLQRKMREAKQRGETVNPAWLFKERRLALLQEQTRQQFNVYAQAAGQFILAEQRSAVDFGNQDANSLLAATGVDVTFNRLPTDAVETLVGFSGDGSPLHKLLAEIPGDAVNTVKQTLLTNLARGLSPQQMAREMTAALDGNRARALTIARTETLRAYREAGRQTAEQVGVRQWQWIAAKSRRTCLACLALDGQIFPIEQPQPAHPNCRCTVLFLPPGLNPPKREYASDWFQKQPDEVKQAMMSKVAFEALQRGDVGLQDFVGIRKSKAWGETRYELSLKEALRQKAERATAKPKRKPAAPKPPKPPKVKEPASRFDHTYLSASDTRAAIAKSAAPYDAEIRSKTDEMNRASRQLAKTTSLLARGDLRNRISTLRGEIQLAEMRRGAAVREHVLVKDSDRATFKTNYKGDAKVPRAVPEGLEAVRAMVGKGLVDKLTHDVNYKATPGRAYYQSNGIFLFGLEKHQTVVHEMGHWLENKVPAFRRAVHDFYAQRTKGDRLEKLRDLTGNKGYRPDEVAKKDKWINVYMGKWYGTASVQADTEILSMGLELMYADAHKLAQQDPEFFDFIYGLIRSTPR